MDGDARLESPQDPQGYTVRLDYPPPPATRADARPAERAPERDDGEDARKQDGADAGNDEQQRPAPRWKKRLYWAVGLLAAAALIIGGVLYWLHARHYETTDDAFIDGHISQVSAQVAARVTRLLIDDNEAVKAGQLLLELDPRDFQVRLDQAKAQRAQAEAQLEQARAGVLMQQANLDQTEANVRVAEADLGQAQADLARYRAVNPQAVSRQQVDQANASAKSAQARLDATRQAVAAARANIESQKAQVAAGEANVAQADVVIANAELQLSYTRIVAPRDGRIAKRTVEVGNYVNPGQALLAVVGNDRWVTANFKETQLALMRPGQSVQVSIDACPDHPFDAKVDSFQPGSGTIFSALPAENATGNYVKVVQRVPVKIVFTDPQFENCHVSPGMSVGPRVTVR
ncbi:MAG: HlyD family secretion protein [Acetobacteraceae bacterium]|nr:HlyD family secretion protein [Acetobacteraceae bacterium]